MSHAIEFVDGRACIAYAGETPWHGLGTRVPNDLTPEQMLQAAGLDWEVELVPMCYEYNGEMKSTDKRALVRASDGKHLTTVSSGWQPVQNAEAFGFFHDLVMAGRWEMHTAGSLNGGRKVWALAKLNEAFELRVNGRKTEDVVEGYCLLTNHHQYGYSTDGRFTGVRVVCNNTHQLAMHSRGQGIVSLNHRQRFDPRRLQEMMGIAHLGMDEYKEIAEFLASKRYRTEDVVSYATRLFPPKANPTIAANDDDRVTKAARQVSGIVEIQPGADFAPGTWWNVFNATTFVMDHAMGKSDDTRLTSSWYGHNRLVRDRALKLAVEMARAA